MALEQDVIAAPDAGYTKFENDRGDYASDSYVNNLIYLTQVNFFPKSLIRWMAGKQWVRTHPQVTKFLVKLMQGTLGGKALYLALLVFRNPKRVVRAILRRPNKLADQFSSSAVSSTRGLASRPPGTESERSKQHLTS